MTLLSSRTLIATALLSAAAAVSATALPGPATAPVQDLNHLHLSQHLAQRTHIAANVMHLAQASQAAPVEAPQAQTAPATPEQGSHRHGMHHGQKHSKHGGHHAGSYREHMQARRAAHHEALKSKLQLTPEQEPAWLAFTARMDAGRGLQRPGAGERVDWSQLTTPERLDKMQERMAERQAAMGQRFDAIKSFYAALSPEQQKVFDSHHMGGQQRAGMQGGGQYRHRHGHHHKHPGMGHDAPAQPQS